jgi:hypothetical protein
LVSLDEMGYARWPDPACDWAEAAPSPAPRAERARSPDRLGRIIGALDAVTGQVHHLDGYIVGRAKVVALDEEWDRAYCDVPRRLVVPDNWSIPSHPDVVAALKQGPRIEPVWLPTYAPWLNPIEELWRWLRQDVLTMHRLAGDWPQLRGRVHQSWDQFATGSHELLRDVGLSGEGKLARALRSPP